MAKGTTVTIYMTKEEKQKIDRLAESERRSFSGALMACALKGMPQEFRQEQHATA